MSVPNRPESEYNAALKMWGGKWGAAIPLLLLICGLLWLSLHGPATPKNFWSIGFAAICIGLFLSKTPKEYCATVLRGFNNKSVGVLCASWIFASVFGQIMQAGGIIEGLLWFGLNVGAQGSVFTVITFLAAMLFSLGTGTANGTILALTPVMFPAGVFLGADPAFLAVAILSGGALGDSYSPISSSNITVAFTQDADIQKITRTRAPLVFTAAAISAIVFACFGGGGTVSTPPQFAVSMSPTCLLLLLAFGIVIVASLLGRHIIESLTWGIAAAIVIGLAIGRLSLSDLLHPVTTGGMSSGLLENGVSGVTGVIIFILFILGVIQLVMRHHGRYRQLGAEDLHQDGPSGRDHDHRLHGADHHPHFRQRPCGSPAGYDLRQAPLPALRHSSRTRRRPAVLLGLYDLLYAALAYRLCALVQYGQPRRRRIRPCQPAHHLRAPHALRLGPAARPFPFRHHGMAEADTDPRSFFQGAK